jgi:hypothetical protein
MRGLGKRIDALEQIHGDGKTLTLWVEFPIDGGLVYASRFYPDGAALLHALGYAQGDIDVVELVGWQVPQTAAELLIEAREMASRPRIQGTPSNIAPESPSQTESPELAPPAALAQTVTSPMLPKVEHRQKYAVWLQYATAPPRFFGDSHEIEPRDGYALGGLPSLFDF